MVDEVKLSPHGSESPVLNQSQDRAATRRADLRKQEQERRRREAVSIFFGLSYQLVFALPILSESVPLAFCPSSRRRNIRSKL